FLTKESGYSAMITMQSWMFLSSYQKLREDLINNRSIVAMAHLGPRAFDSIGGEVVSTTAFILENLNIDTQHGTYINLIKGRSESEKKELFLRAINDSNCGYLYRFKGSDFKKIPGYPVAYWISEKIVSAYSNPLLSKYLVSDGSVKTGNNEKYLR